MKKIACFLFITMLAFPVYEYAQKGNVKKKTTKTHQSKSIKQQYLFEEVWVWTYVDYDGNKGEIEAYRESNSGSWLIPKTSLGSEGEMIEFIIGHTDGSYLIAWQDAELGAKKRIERQKLHFQAYPSIPGHWKSINQSNEYGDTDLGYHKIKGNGYKMSYEKTNDQSTIFLGQDNVNFHPLYYINQLDLEAKLPIHFPLDVPANIIALEEQSIINNRNIGFEFKFISATEYHVDLKDYSIR